MAKLITHHDPFHIHKILGVFVLIHFLYRTLLVLYRGFVFCSIDNDLCTSRETNVDAICILLHAALSWSALLMPLPAKRNFSSPMIWVEFRWHSITFATRAVVASLVSLYGLWPTHSSVANYAAKVALLLTTCYTADYITQKYGCHEKRTTNAMPYPDCITAKMQSKIKYNYAMAQFAAAISCISGQPQLSWATLLAIQGAPLLMTLVRKGKITSLTYHRVYMVLLISPMYWFLLGNTLHWNYSSVNQHTSKLIFVAAFLHLISTALRIRFRQSKFVTWTVTVALFNGITQTPMIWSFFHWLYTHPVGLTILTFRYVMVSQRILRHYVPVFTGATKAPMQWDYIWANALARILLQPILLVLWKISKADKAQQAAPQEDLRKKPKNDLLAIGRTIVTSPRLSQSRHVCESPFKGAGRDMRRRLFA